MLIRKKILFKSYESRIEEVKEDLNLSIEKENKIRFLQNEILSLRDKLEQKEEVQENLINMQIYWMNYFIKEL